MINFNPSMVVLDNSGASTWKPTTSHNRNEHPRGTATAAPARVALDVD